MSCDPTQSGIKTCDNCNYILTDKQRRDVAQALRGLDESIDGAAGGGAARSDGKATVRL